MNRHIDPVTLRLFVAICEEGSIARAADRAALVASALSKRIGALEDQLATRLLVRSRRGVAPTAAGEALLRQAREVLGALDRLNAELDGFAAGVQGSVRVAASVSALAEFLPDDVASFLKRHPTLRVSLDERGSNEVVRDVRAGSADLGIAWDAVDARGLFTQPYHTDHLQVVLPPDHPLAGKRHIRFADTLAHPSVGVASTGLVAALLNRHAALLGRALVHRMQVSSLEACLRLVAAGLGLAIVPAQTVATQLDSTRVLMRPLRESWSVRQFVLITRDPAGLSAAARLLLAHLSQEVSHDRPHPHKALTEHRR